MAWYNSVTSDNSVAGLDGYQWPTFSDSISTTESSQTFIPDDWGGAIGDFLTGGMNLFKDYNQITGNGAWEAPAVMSPDQWSEKNAPVNTQTPTTGMVGGQIVPGIGNGVLLLAGAAVAVVMLTK